MPASGGRPHSDKRVIRQCRSCPTRTGTIRCGRGRCAVIPYPLGRAIKIVMPRRVTAGDPGDTDAYGAQQHRRPPTLACISASNEVAPIWEHALRAAAAQANTWIILEPGCHHGPWRPRLHQAQGLRNSGTSGRAVRVALSEIRLLRSRDRGVLSGVVFMRVFGANKLPGFV